ncbi:bifunctional glycosyltransferase family 2/GtrA family protein [Brachybacterium huguangmaarense]|uniref:Bifunctional glycosyltransferase family 2/GtrA family protein n=1 Tax=Brachybacterium huguangmaarense TaxID=1652028 RepID=A0ABY6G2L6_9MICO|nr:bifunctional glycosyltransferase family 2/GtrA family protein [Brachybacterium huguangmaarense]UYG17455.1 bifunctional glycosyltransferase family 2/GtrA family protein [Brachybacterium huguangmaarense]
MTAAPAPLPGRARPLTPPLTQADSPRAVLAPAPTSDGTAPRGPGAVVAIPALEPGPELVRLVGDLAAEGIDVIVVDDGSGPRFDVVFDRCELAGARVLRCAHNRGKGTALREAFAAAQRCFPGSDVVTADADGQHTLVDIRRLREELGRSGSADRAPIVLGVRAFDGEVPLRSRFGNALSSLAFRAAAGVSLGDTQTGLRGIPARHLTWARTLPGDRYEYEYTMLVRAARDGIGLHQVPISTVYEDDNASSHFRPVRDSLRVLGPVLAFAASSLAAFTVDTGIFWMLTAIGLPVAPALAIARLVSSAGNFSMNRWVVFRGGLAAPLGRAALRYALLAGAVLGGGILLVDALMALGLAAVPAKIAADLLLFSLSFVVQKVLVFRRP